MSKSIEGKVKSCITCRKFNYVPPEPILPTNFPDKPWQHVATDLFEYNKRIYILVVDYFLSYIELALLSNTTSGAIITNLKSIFARHGIPEKLRSDNGPQYSSDEFKKFAHDYDFEHEKSSLGYPKCNGEAERAVKTIKSLLNKNSDPYIALLTYRSSPLQNGYSPDELLFNRRIRTTLPSFPHNVPPPCINKDALLEKEDHYKKQMKANFDKRHRTKTQSILDCGDEVIVRKKLANLGQY